MSSARGNVPGNTIPLACVMAAALFSLISEGKKISLIAPENAGVIRGSGRGQDMGSKAPIMSTLVAAMAGTILAEDAGDFSILAEVAVVKDGAILKIEV